eukprot:SAG31_NODE_8435_length_1452_cov_8.202450_1_plen_123_part_00
MIPIEFNIIDVSGPSSADDFSIFPVAVALKAQQVDRAVGADLGVLYLKFHIVARRGLASPALYCSAYVHLGFLRTARPSFLIFTARSSARAWHGRPRGCDGFRSLEQVRLYLNLGTYEYWYR